MKILIHAVPERMWYVDEFLVPALRAQGAETVEIWNDAEHTGNLAACMAAFAAREGDSGTWHLQDDVLPCRDFVKRCRDLDDGVVFGFACRNFEDRIDAWGRVYAPDAWHSFQCVRIPDAYARECEAWLHGEGMDNENYPLWIRSGKMDDSVFRTFLVEKHGRETVENLKPCLVDHVDFILGGSVLHPWRGHLARATWFEDEALVRALKESVKGHVQYV